MAGEDPGVAVVPVGAVEALVGGVVAAAGAVREGGVALVGEEEAGLLPVADEEALDSVVAVVDAAGNSTSVSQQWRVIDSIA